MRTPLAVIGMSPGNSYFKDYEVRFLLQEAVKRFGRCAVMVADVPAISTYVALGYDHKDARNKAIPKGNNLKNRTRRLAEALGYTEDQVRIIDWAEEVENNPAYQAYFDQTMANYASLPGFAASVRDTTRDVLSHSGRNFTDFDAAVGNATHYLLSELAFMAFAPEFFGIERVCYLYHRNWPVYEDFIAGRHDGIAKPHLDFLLLEAPYETYAQTHGAEIAEAGTVHDTYSRVMQSGMLRAAYIDYPPVMYRRDGQFRGVFCDIISGFCRQHGLTIEWVEETGYGVVIDGLAEGRFDIFTSATWPTPERHTKAGLSRPVYYSDVGVWVAEAGLRDADWLDLNHPDCRIAVTEGDITHEICLTDFIFAKWVRAPQLGRVKALLDLVAEGGADATMVERITYEAYADSLTRPLVNIAHDKPIRRYPNSFLVGKNQNDFLDMIDRYIDDLQRAGGVRGIVSRYISGPEAKGIYFRHLAG